jgi:hypothetical protein
MTALERMDDLDVQHSGSGRLRPRTLLDPLYSTIRVSGWVAALLETPPFRRLAGVSLSDVPGELLFGRPFPSRLDHALGVYHLARLARPRDRALQAAALAHDLGHGPFSHLTEPLMRECYREDHEVRSARLLGEVRSALSAVDVRLVAGLDWDDVAQLVLGGGASGRGALLNGLLDYDNADNVARFLLGSGLGAPSYDPRVLARSLRLVPGEAAACLGASAETDARGWQADRARVYGFLHEGHHNLAAHSMLRKAVDMAAAVDFLPAGFFSLTDGGALELLGRAPDRGLASLVGRVRQRDGCLYRCVWEAEVPEIAGAALDDALASWRGRLALEARLACEAGLAAHEVVVEALTSRAVRPLPPIARPGVPLDPTSPAEQTSAPCVLHVFAAADAGRDYIHRLRIAADRHLGARGAVAHRDTCDEH